MAKVQYVYIKRKDSQSGQTGTVTYDLPTKGYIPEIVVRAYSTPTASTDPALPLNDAITKIEIVDGGTVIKSLTGNQAHGLEMIHKSKTRVSTEVNDNAVEGYDDFVIVLGKVVNGVSYAPDFSRFANAQIKISWDYSITTGFSGATFDADSSPAMKFTVFAKVVREGGRYTHGYVKSNQIYTWTSANTATTQTEVPIGQKLLGLGIEAGYDDDDWTEDIETIELNFDNGAWIPLKLYEEEIMKFQEQVFGSAFEVSFTADIISGVEIDSHMGWVKNIDINAVGVVGGSFAKWPISTIGVEEVSFLDSYGAAIAAYQQAVFHVVGFCPYGLWYLPMSVINNGDNDLIDTNQYGRIVLETVSGSSVNTSSTPAVIAEYLVT